MKARIGVEEEVGKGEGKRPRIREKQEKKNPV